MATMDDPSGGSTRGPGRLWVVATPIGNLGDLSPRARKVLGEVAAILAEDTRVVRKLLTSCGLPARTVALHEHNEDQLVPRVLARLGRGEDLALVSDAGTPLLADPGYRLVRACREAGIQVLAVPGPSSITAALSVAGVPPYPFTFAGFLPPKTHHRRRTLQRMADLPHTLVVFLSPHRLAVELADCRDLLGPDREAVLLAELTKLHERALGGILARLCELVGETPARGEFTLVVGPPGEHPRSRPPTREEAERALQSSLAAGEDLATARRTAARKLGISRRELYARLTGKAAASAPAGPVPSPPSRRPENPPARESPDQTEPGPAATRCRRTRRRS